VTKTLRQPDPEEQAQAELAEAERKMKAGKAVQDELVRLHSIAWHKAHALRLVREEKQRCALAEQERRKQSAKLAEIRAAQKTQHFDEKLAAFERDYAKQKEAGNANGLRALDVLIANTKQARALALQA
jgi:hypothetical protein